MPDTAFGIGHSVLQPRRNWFHRHTADSRGLLSLGRSDPAGHRLIRA